MLTAWLIVWGDIRKHSLLKQFWYLFLSLVRSAPKYPQRKLLRYFLEYCVNDKKKSMTEDYI